MEAPYSLFGSLLVITATLAFVAYETFRLRRFLHVFQLEGYKRDRFLAWTRLPAVGSPPPGEKKPLVMTGRASRLLFTSALFVLALSGGMFFAGGLFLGRPWDAVLGALGALSSHLFLPLLLLAADLVLAPLQKAINSGYMRKARRRLSSLAPVVIGVTGSYGKTSSKFAIATLLGAPEEALATPGSYNTPLGVSRTINEALSSRHRYFVVEMGAYDEGEIARLCDFVHPSVGVLTAIGPVHLERFGSMEAIRRAKYEIVTSLPPEGIAVMNVDNPMVRELADQTRDKRVIRYGLDSSGNPEVSAGEVDISQSGTSFRLLVRGEEPLEVSTRLLGKPAVSHVLAGVAVGRALGFPLGELGRRIARLEPVPHRLELIRGEGGVTVIDDAYNSNPEGAKAALEVLASMPARRRIVVTPGMIELGPVQAEANREFGERAGKVADEVVIVTEVNRRALAEGARSAGAGVHEVPSLAAASTLLQELLAPGDVVLFENDLPDQYETAPASRLRPARSSA